MMDDSTALWYSLRDLFESRPVGTTVDVAKTEVIAASVSLMVKQGDVVTMKSFFFPPKEQT